MIFPQCLRYIVRCWFFGCKFSCRFGKTNNPNELFHESKKDLFFDLSALGGVFFCSSVVQKLFYGPATTNKGENS